MTPFEPTASADLVADNLVRLRELFPEANTEGKIDFDVLKQLLGGAVEEREEKYGLNWHGKRRARQLALTPSTGTLRPCPGDGIDEATTQNIVIEGDNLEVLKLLQKSYSGKVKLIYIDPPYNTGNDFVYSDNFADSIGNYKRFTGQLDESGAKLTSNSSTSGRFHTNWLNMMYSRLKLARNLLAEDGFLAMSIDDHETHHAQEILEDLFGIENYIGCLTWIASTQPDNIGSARFGLQKNIEYVHLVTRNISKPRFILEEKGEARQYPHKGKHGPCRFEIIERANAGAYSRETMLFPILGKNPRPGKQWQIGEELARQLERDEKVELVDGIVKRAVYPEDEIDDMSYHPFWSHLSQVATSQQGKAELSELMEGHGFDTVKPMTLILKLMSHIVRPQDLILDFFAGSGTTGHAVIQQNAQDGGNRRYILVQLPEPLDPANKEQKTAANFCDSLGKPRTIAELTKERLRRAGKKVKGDNPMFAGDVGFRVFKLDSSNIRTWEPDRANLDKTLEEAMIHIKPDRTEADILTELLLKLGLDLTVPIETKTIAGKLVHSIGAGAMMVCLAPDIARADAEPLALGIAAWHKEQQPAGESQVVFRDSAFADDVAKSNLAAILAQHGLTNIRSL